MSTIRAKRNGAREKITSAKFLSTSALTAAGLIAFSASPAKADDIHSWDNLSAQKGQFLTDTSVEDVTTITLTTSRATAIGNADIYEDDTVNVDGRMFVVKDNRADPTRILGKLNSNGRVVVIDANGVFFGGNSRVDVAGMVATTGELNENKLDEGDVEVALSDVSGSIEVAEGAQISVGSAGLAAFVAPTVINNGIVNAKMGNVVMAAGEKVTLDLYGDGLVEVAVDGDLGDALLENKGTINAQGGTVQITAKAAKQAVDNIINVSGVIDVSSVTQKGGKIILSGGGAGVVKVSGNLKASGKTGGGDIKATGKNVHIAKDATLDVNAEENGDGGTAYIYGDQFAIFEGSLTGRGGAVSGNGGDAEISAADSVGFYGLVDLGAANGDKGALLIDPEHLTISNAAFSADLTALFTLGLLGQININDQALANALHNNHVNLWATDTLSITSDIDISEYDYTTGILWWATHHNGITSNNLSLAAPTVNIFGDVTLGNGQLNVRDMTAADSVLGFNIINPPHDINVNELNLGGKIYKRTTLAGPSFLTLADDAQINTTSTTINVLSNDALIQQAIHFADSTAQKVINVALDTYTENLLVNKNDLKLDGAGATLRYDNANSGSGTAGNLVTVTADNVNIDPFVFDGLGIANYGINATGADNLIIDGNTFQNFLLTNVNVTNSSGVRIFGNTMTGAQKGVYANNTPDIWVYTNTINGATVAGVQVVNTNGTDYGNDIDIWHNQINSAASAVGVLVENSNYATIGAHLTNQPNLDDALNGNIITGGTNGVVVVNSANAMVRHNDISGASQDGVEVNGGSGVKVLDNDISNIGWDGIQFNGSTNGEIAGNVITNVTGASGIAVMGGSHDTLIDDNEIDGVDRLGIYVWNSNGLEITGNDVNNTGREGGNNWFLSGVHLENSSNSTIQGNLIRNTRGDAIHVGGADNAAAVATTGNSILDNVIGYTGMSVVASAGDDNVKGDGIEIVNSDNAFIQGNKIIDASGNGIYNNSSDNTVIGGLGVLGNFITSVDLSGVLVNPSFNVDVIGNVITTANEGVKLVGNTDIDVLYNMISDINTDGVQISGHNGVLNVTGNSIGADDHGIYHDDNITAGDNVDIHDNIINANQDNGAIGSGIFFNGTVSGGTIDIGNGDNYYNEGNPSNIITVADNTLNANDDNLDGIHFNKSVSGGVINIDGNRIGMTGTPNAAGSEGNFYSLTDDGIEFRGAVNGSADINISDNTITAIDDGIRFNGAVGGNATITVGDGGAYSNDIQGNSGNGIVFESTVSGQALIDIVNNIQIRGGLDGIAFEGETSNFLTPPGASQQEINISGNNGVGNLGGILGGNNGIRFAQKVDTDLHDIRIAGNRIIGSSQHGIAFNGDIGGDESQLWINDNSYIRGNLDGIHFGEEIIGEAAIEIADNAWIEGVHDDAIDFSEQIVGGATIRIKGNDNIIATNISGADADNGIEFDAVSDSVIEITGNNHGIHANDHGVFFGGNVSGGSEINIHDNIISANENGGIGDGIHFAGNVTDSDIFIGDGLSAGYFANTSNIIRGNDGIHFAGDINGNSDIVIDGNHLGYYRDALGNEFADELNDDGIEFAGHINGNSEITVTDNRINADDDGIRFAGEIRDNADILIGGFGNGNVIFADDDGIQFADDVEDNSEIAITWNEIESDDNGIAFNGTTSNTGDLGNEDILIAYNDIEADANGVVFTGRAEGAFHDIMIRDNFQVHGHGGHGIAHTGGIDDAELRILDNDDIYGDTDGIQVSGFLFNNALVDINGNTVEGTNGGDGIEVTDAGFLGGVDVNITDNHIHFVGDNGIEVNNVPDVFIGFNEIHDADSNGIYVSNSANAQIRWNDVWNTDEDGVFVIGSQGSNIEDNDLWFIGDDGIDVRDSSGTEIEDNFIFVTRGDGIQVRGSSFVNVDDNFIRFAGDDGIDFENGFFSSIIGNDIRFVDANGIEIEDSAFIVADSNTVQNSGDAGIFVDPSAFILVSNNTLRFNEYGVRFDEVYLSAIYDNVIEDNRVAGVRLNDSHGIAVWRNDIANNGRYGLWADGGQNGYINVAGNNFLDNPTHARFESGIIDLTWVDPLLGYGNTFVGGNIGLEFDVWNNDTPRLSLVRAGGGYTYDGNPFDTFNGVNVAGNPALNFGGTIGQQYFEGQSQYFVAVRSDTFTDRAGNAVWLDASDSTYFMPGEGLITGDVLTQAQFDFLEEKFRHWPDVNNRGIFWFGAVPDETTLSILKDPIYTPYDAGVSGLNVTITGLPRIGGGAPVGAPGISGLNQIAPAAGDETGAQGEVADIEPAAGGNGNDQPASQNASCWGDAVSAAGAGSAVTYSYGGTFEESVAAAASCNTASLF